MPHQNRVTPFGTLVATPERGTLMGNRGCLHDADGRIRRLYALRRWILCVLQFRGRQRKILSPGRYTELFFLDEATGLAAGHRPCAECQRGRYRLFCERWGGSPRADRIDAVLHAERLDADRSKRTALAPMTALPAGVMVLLDEAPWLVLGDAVVPWSAGGYGARRPKPGGTVRVLTPISTVASIARGYPVEMHPSAGGTG
jgi:hypothetical protein